MQYRQFDKMEVEESCLGSIPMPERMLQNLLEVAVPPCQSLKEVLQHY